MDYGFGSKREAHATITAAMYGHIPLLEREWATYERNAYYWGLTALALELTTLRIERQSSKN